MSIALDVSQGVDLIPVGYDVFKDEHSAFVDGKLYRMKSPLPFTTKVIRRNGYDAHAADKALILKYGVVHG